jgi:hypothetical protein
VSETLRIIDAALLLLFASMYFGTGWSLVLFSFPLASKLTPDNYRLPFVEPVVNATRFFTWMTAAMLAVPIPLIVGERHTGYVWVPVVYLAATIAATALTLIFIFPYNKELREGVTDPARLRLVLGRWMRLNVVRVLLWTVEWVAVTLYFCLEAA